MKSFIVKAENDFKDSVKASAMEGISFGSVHRGIDLGGIFAILQTELYMLGVDPLVVAPSQVKKYATGNAKAEKLQMINSAKISFGAKVNNDNEADAVILANISRSFCTSAPLDDRPKLEVMKALRDKADDTKMRVPTKRKSREPNI
jgi:crossover junction endodeoxyribonuclease RuvC